VYIVPAWLDDVVSNGLGADGHWCPIPHNVAQLARHPANIYLSVRDPREALWSLFRFLEEKYPLEQIATPYVPLDYFRRDYNERLLSMIKGYFPYLVHWLRSWKEYLSEPGHSVTVVRYEDFAQDNGAAIMKLLDCAGFEVSQGIVEGRVRQMQREAVEGGKHHFRSGQSASWRNAFGEAALLEIDRHWDADVLGYFGYGK
jgi:hypothetical protein